MRENEWRAGLHGVRADPITEMLEQRKIRPRVLAQAMGISERRLWHIRRGRLIMRVPELESAAVWFGLDVDVLRRRLEQAGLRVAEQPDPERAILRAYWHEVNARRAARKRAQKNADANAVA